MVALASTQERIQYDEFEEQAVPMKEQEELHPMLESVVKPEPEVEGRQVL